MSVTVTPGATNEPLKFGTPASVFRAPHPKGTAIAGAMYDVAPDGKFVVVTSHGRESRLVVAVNALEADPRR